MYEYFVSYYATFKSCKQAVGHCAVELNYKIKTYDDINRLKNSLIEQNNYFDVVILYFKLLGGDDE